LPSFIVQSPIISADQNPAAEAVADFFSHGQSDLAVTNGNLGQPNGTVAIYENTTTSSGGDITFAQTQDIPVGKEPIGIATGQFTGDGFNDLVVADAGDGTIAVLLNDPNNPGTFQTPAYYTVGGMPFAVVVGRFTTSGNQDIVVGTSNYYLGYSTDTISVLFGNGDGTFQPPIQISTGGEGGQDMAAVPFEAGGNYNIVVANTVSNTVSVLFGNGDGTFQPPVIYPVGVQPYTVAVGDVNNDGYPDLITANQGDGTVSVLLNDGTDNFPTRIDYPAGGNPTDVVLGSFHGDNQVDIAVSNFLVFGGGVSVLLNNGDGTFGPATQYPTGVLAAGIVVADFNGDGFPDIVVANAFGNSISVVRNDGMQPSPPPGGSADAGRFPPAPALIAAAHPADVLPIFASSETHPATPDEGSLRLMHGLSAQNAGGPALVSDLGGSDFGDWIAW
jgi:hypothetical protein